MLVSAKTDTAVEQAEAEALRCALLRQLWDHQDDRLTLRGLLGCWLMLEIHWLTGTARTARYGRTLWGIGVEVEMLGDELGIF